MRRIGKIILALSFAGAVGAVTLSSAAPASAQGFYFDAPGVHVGVGHPWHRHYYGRRYGYGYYDYAGPNCYYNGCCPAGMTIQNGVCKPYRGY